MQEEEEEEEQLLKLEGGMELVDKEVEGKEEDGVWKAEEEEEEERRRRGGG